MPEGLRAEPSRPSTFVISITPFDAAGRIDEPGMRAHLRRMVAAGIGVYIGFFDFLWTQVLQFLVNVT